MEQKRNERTLQEIIDYLKIENGHYGSELSFVETKILLNYIEWLNKRIDKAIEYIEERYNGEVLTHTFDKDNVGELLEILKGE